jgi:hypothetical protein|tara:strand:+ start:450 stop:644 length:195 start_codon:yes stop_codon:yes gene_type:complete
MKHVRIVDKRPALAFDSQEETQLIADSLNAYRYSHVINTELNEKIRTLCDVVLKCQEMFNKKEE